ncbi:hypothetical protein ACM26V_06645 [Salipaludibacillus sp. HK11]|uniref:hypothetical protein n=1 Tax=Salipaludibacillus sp. HK11 TaxID=3394320 RepID=UPI0039FBD45C
MAKLTVEEEQLVESYILLEMARKVLERDLAHINQAPLKLKEPYIHLLEMTLHRLSRKLYVTKFTMKQLGLKIQLNAYDKTFSEYTIFFRGYILTAKYLNTHLRNQVSKQIEDLFTYGKKEIH